MFKKRRHASLEARVLRSNQTAMGLLKLEKYSECLALLRSAEEKLAQAPSELPEKGKLVAITLNNLGCYYKKRGQLKVALEYLHSALEIELQLVTDPAELASTYLNITAIYSGLRQHAEALHFGRKAIQLLESTDDRRSNRCTSLLIAYHNAGTELEHLQRFNDARQYFEKGRTFGTRYLARNMDARS